LEMKGSCTGQNRCFPFWRDGKSDCFVEQDAAVKQVREVGERGREQVELYEDWNEYYSSWFCLLMLMYDGLY
jgi:hypothetical protein